MKLMHRIAAGIVTLGLLGSLTSFAQSEDRRVRIVNETSSPIQYFYATNVDSSTWGPDLLGPLVMIYPNYYMVFNLDDGSGHCLYDLRAKLFDGREAIHRSFNVCTGASWTVTEGN